MEYIINGEPVNITGRAFGKGSEGQVYRKDNTLYKIYYPSMINEGYGSKQKDHTFMSTIETSQIILPNNLIYDTQGKYVGYTAKLIEGDQKKKTGITQIPSQSFIKNLQILENDFNILTNNYVVGADISPVNYIFNKDKQTMNIIDPGRYRHSPELLKSSCELRNRNQYNNLVELLLYIDFMDYKPVKTKRKLQLIKERIKQEHSTEKYSEFFKSELKNYENVHEYAKSLEKYIK